METAESGAMTLDRDGLRRVLEAFDAGNWDEIHLETGDSVVHLSTAGQKVSDAQTSDVSPVRGVGESTRPAAETAPVQAPPVSSVGADADDSVAGTGSAVATPRGSAEVLDIVAPSPGIFWRSPSPGAPPFAETGARVEPEAVLCIVEVMKLMNTVAAPRAGVVAEVLVGNGEEVELGQVLFRLHVDQS